MACGLCDMRGEGELLLLETACWRVYLSFKQDYWGRCIVVLRRHCESLGGLTDAEWVDFGGVVRRMEAALRAALGAEPLNWGCLMNEAYQHDPAGPHVHFHLRPRYRAGVEVAGARFEDAAFGRHYAHGLEMAPEGVAAEVFARVRARLDGDAGV